VIQKNKNLNLFFFVHLNWNLHFLE